ncbi:hypothetical protein AB6804_31635, partial [Caballeronia sp. RCC_10]
WEFRNPLFAPITTRRLASRHSARPTIYQGASGHVGNRPLQAIIGSSQTAYLGASGPDANSQIAMRVGVRRKFCAKRVRQVRDALVHEVIRQASTIHAAPEAEVLHKVRVALRRRRMLL